jgi:hypothetical protein
MNGVNLKRLAILGLLSLVSLVPGCGSGEIKPGEAEDPSPQTPQQIQDARMESLRHMPPEYRAKMEASLKKSQQSAPASGSPSQ